MQNRNFLDVDTIPHLSCFKDMEIILKIKTRITEHIDTPYSLSHIRLPDDSIFTIWLFELFHVVNRNSGIHIILDILR